MGGIKILEIQVVRTSCNNLCSEEFPYYHSSRERVIPAASHILKACTRLPLPLLPGPSSCFPMFHFHDTDPVSINKLLQAIYGPLAA